MRIRITPCPHTKSGFFLLHFCLDNRIENIVGYSMYGTDQNSTVVKIIFSVNFIVTAIAMDTGAGNGATRTTDTGAVTGDTDTTDTSDTDTGAVTGDTDTIDTGAGTGVLILMILVILILPILVMVLVILILILLILVLVLVILDSGY